MSLIYVGESNVFLDKNAQVVGVAGTEHVPPNEDEGRRHVRAALAKAAQPLIEAYARVGRLAGEAGVWRDLAAQTRDPAVRTLALAHADEVAAKQQEAVRRAQDVEANNEAAVVACAALKELADLSGRRFEFG
jgi:hypothetical protein